jgi:cytochrome P450
VTLPPGPKAPPLWQSARFLTRPLDFFDEMVRTYGATFTVRLAGLPTLVMLTTPAHLKALFTSPVEVMHAGEANASAFGPIVGTRTHFVMEGASHLDRRRMLLPSFHGDRMHEYGEAMDAVTCQALASWPEGRPFPIHPELQQIALQVILRTIFGLDDATSRDELLRRQLVRLANVALASPLLFLRPLQWDLGPFSPWGRVTRVVKDSDTLLMAEIGRRRQAGDGTGRKDILSLLLLANNEQGEGLSDDELRDELVTLVLAGHETTGTSLSWALECLLRRPAVIQRIRDEIAQVAGQDEVPRGPEQLARLEYLDATIKEVLRFRPIMAFGGTRVLQAPFRIAGYELPAGVGVANALSMVHRRPDLYPEPEEFRPERFLGKKPDPYEWTPFGGGVRRCLGMAFALYEMKIVLATLLAGADLALAPGYGVKVVRRNITWVPSEGMPVVLTRRAA